MENVGHQAQLGFPVVFTVCQQEPEAVLKRAPLTPHRNSTSENQNSTDTDPNLTFHAKILGVEDSDPLAPDNLCIVRSGSGPEINLSEKKQRAVRRMLHLKVILVLPKENSFLSILYCICLALGLYPSCVADPGCLYRILDLKN